MNCLTQHHFQEAQHMETTKLDREAFCRKATEDLEKLRRDKRDTGIQRALMLRFYYRAVKTREIRRSKNNKRR